VREVKILLMTELGRKICTDVLQVALNDDEERIAILVILFYQVNLNKN